MNVNTVGAILAGATLMALLLAAGAPPAAAQGSSGDGGNAATSGIVVQGTGEVQVRPDLARLFLGVQTQAKEAGAAAQENATRTEAVIGAVKAAGVAENDVQTADYAINPQYDYRPQPENRTPQVAGYQVSNTVRVVVRKIADVGKVLDAAIKAGANVAGGVRFELSDDKAARQEALTRAVADGKNKATILAKAAGVVRIELVSIVENSSNVPRPYDGVVALRSAEAASGAATPVAPGEQTVSATITLRYRFSPESVREGGAL